MKNNQKNNVFNQFKLFIFIETYIIAICKFSKMFKNSRFLKINKKKTYQQNQNQFFSFMFVIILLHYHQKLSLCID